MKETSARLLRLLSVLQTRREWSGADLAGRLGISTRTLRRDVDKLRELDYPIHAGMGPGGGYRLGAGAALPRCCSTTTKPSRSRWACAQRPGARSPA